MVQVTVRNVSGQELELELFDTETAFDVKQKIQALWGLPPACQELVLQSTLRTIADADSFATGEELELLLICSLREVCARLGSGSVTKRASALKDLAAVRGHASAVDAALQCLEDPNAHVRDRAVDAILQVANTGNQSVLDVANRLLGTQEAELGLRLIAGVAPRGDAACISRLLFHLQSGEEVLRRASARALAKVAEPGHAEVKAALLARLEDTDKEGYENVRIEALRALGALGAGIPEDLEVLAAVLRALVDSNSHTQKAASATILQLLDVLDVGSRQAVMALAIDQLQHALEKENWCATLDLLARLAEGAGAGEVEVLVRALFPLLKAWDPDVQRSATVTLLPLVFATADAANIERRLYAAGFLVPDDILQEVAGHASKWLEEHAVASHHGRA